MKAHAPNESFAFGRLELTRDELTKASDAMLRSLHELLERALFAAEVQTDRKYYAIKRLYSAVDLELEERYATAAAVKRIQPSLFAKQDLRALRREVAQAR